MKQIYLKSIQHTFAQKKVSIVLNYATQNSRYAVHFLHVRFAKIAKRIEIISEKIEIFTIDFYNRLSCHKCVRYKCD